MEDLNNLIDKTLLTKNIDQINCLSTILSEIKDENESLYALKFLLEKCKNHNVEQNILNIIFEKWFKIFKCTEQINMVISICLHNIFNNVLEFIIDKCNYIFRFLTVLDNYDLEITSNEFDKFSDLIDIHCNKKH